MTNSKNRSASAKKASICACVSGILFLLLILLVKTVDVAPVGAAGTSIGLSHINTAFAKMTGINTIWYKITEVFGVCLILVAGAFAVTGLLQLIRRKSLLKVDKEILSLGGLYAAVVVLYVLFEKVVINYRPILMEGSTEPEASFPSSHTMLVCVVMGSAMMILNRYIKNATLAKVLKAVCAVVIVLTVVGRLICGVHWLTDITGGVLISLTLLGIFKAVIGE